MKALLRSLVVLSALAAIGQLAFGTKVEAHQGSSKQGKDSRGATSRSGDPGV